MKFEVTTWFKDASIRFLGRLVELLFRLVLIFLPLGAFLLLIQMREKPSKVSSISVYTTDASVWQHVFPGFLLVAINPRVLEESWKATKGAIQNWVLMNRYILSLLFMMIIVILMVVKGN